MSAVKFMQNIKWMKWQLSNAGKGIYSCCTENKWSFSKSSDQRNSVSPSKKSFFHCFALMWRLKPTLRPPHPQLTTQPPTSQLAEQICSCLSSQYVSHTSSWLGHSKQTKVAKLPLSEYSAFILSTVSTGFPLCAQIPHLIHSVNKRKINK